MKIKQKLMILMCISALFLSACSSNGGKDLGDKNDVVQTQAVAAEQEKDVSKFTNNPFMQDDLYEDWSKSNTTIITMNEISISHDGDENSGVQIDGNHITITKGGDFAVTGACANGSITVDCADTDTVRLILDNCSLTNQEGSVLDIKKAAKVIVTSPFETTNSLVDGYEYTDGSADNAAISSDANLSFNGSGELTIGGNYQDAVVCNSDLKFASGTYYISGKNNAVVASKGISLKTGAFYVSAGEAGFKATSTDDGEGYIGIETGSYVVSSLGNAFDAAGSMYYLNGSLAITTTMDNSLADGGSAKGIKAGQNVEMYGGSAQIQTADDAVYAMSNVKIATGCLNVTSGDDGIVAGDSIEIAGGSVVLSQCVEGFESNNVKLTGGFVDINSTNDGINICGGNDGSAAEERDGKNDIERSGEGELSIDQTCINIKSDADAIDVVGSINVLSGAVNVRGGQAEGNSSVDCSKDYVIKSGNVNAAGGDETVVMPSDASEQNTVVIEYASAQEADSVVCIKNDKNEIISCFAPATTYTKAIISKPDLKEGMKCTWYTAKLKADAATNFGEVSSNDVEVGDKLGEFTVEKGTVVAK